ncbi:MAG: P1 family peptidase [Chitinophagaceae bacterium]
MRIFIFLLTYLLIAHNAFAQSKRPRDFGIAIGILPTGSLNSITDVAGVKVGHATLIKGDSVRTGVTAILPHNGNIFQQKVPAAIYVGNGFGKLAGVTQVQELGNIETPIILTNTLSVPAAMNVVIDYTLHQKGNENVRSVNAVIGETNDGWVLNDIRGRHVQKQDVLNAIRNASFGKVEEGNVGAGTGTIAFGFKGGIGTASRKIPQQFGGYTVGVLVQSNFGGVLQIDGVPVGEELKKYYLSDELSKADGSCMIVVATDAPLDSRNLERLAKRAFMGLAKTGGIAHNGSGDYVIAFSTDTSLRIPHDPKSPKQTFTLLNNDAVSPLFMAAIEATEEAIINSLFAAKTTTANGNTVEALPLEKVIAILKQYNRIK